MRLVNFKNKKNSSKIKVKNQIFFCTRFKYVGCDDWGSNILIGFI